MKNKIDVFLFRIQNDQSQPQRDPAGPHKETLEGVRQWLHREFTTLATKAEKIHADASLSDVGKRQRLADLATKQELRFLTTKRTEIQANLERYQGILFTTPKSERDPVLAYLNEQEIRSELKGTSQHERDLAYLNAVQADQHETVRALTAGPRGSLVSAEFQQRIMNEHAQKSQPAVFANYEQAQILKEHLDSLETHATQVLQALGAPKSVTA